MKAFLVAVLLVLAVASGSALKCRRCVSSVPGVGCTVSTETCSSRMDACVAARFLHPPFSYFNRCIRMTDCRILQTSPHIKANCCQTDMCNISSL